MYCGMVNGFCELDMGVSQIRRTFLGVPIISIIVVWGLYWSSLFWATTI